MNSNTWYSGKEGTGTSAVSIYFFLFKRTYEREVKENLEKSLIVMPLVREDEKADKLVSVTRLYLSGTNRMKLETRTTLVIIFNARQQKLH